MHSKMSDFVIFYHLEYRCDTILNRIVENHIQFRGKHNSMFISSSNERKRNAANTVWTTVDNVNTQTTTKKSDSNDDSKRVV